MLVASLVLAPVQAGARKAPHGEPWLWYYSTPGVGSFPKLIEVAANGGLRDTNIRALDAAQPFVTWLPKIKRLAYAGRLGKVANGLLVSGETMPSPDGKSSIVYTAIEDYPFVLRVLPRKRELMLQQVRSADPHEKPLQAVLSVRWSPSSNRIAFCVMGEVWLDDEQSSPEHLTYVWDLNTNRVQRVGRGFHVVWIDDNNLAVTGEINSQLEHRGKDLSATYQYMTQIVSATGKVIRSKLFGAAWAYSPSRKSLLMTEPYAKQKFPIDMRLFEADTMLRDKHGFSVPAQMGDAQSFQFYVNGMTAR